MLGGAALDTDAQMRLDKRIAERTLAKELVERKAFNIQDGVAWLVMTNSIEKLIRPIDANFGGRWNAGWNKRGGGSTIPPKDYAEAIMTNLRGQ